MNQLPQATALHIDPSAFMPKVDRATLKRKLWAPQASPRKSVEPKVVPVVVRIAQRDPATPIWRTVETNFNAHEEFWAEWRINRPRAYVMAQAKAAGFSFVEMQCNLRPRPMAAVRQRLMAEVWQLFGLSLAQIGTLFGGRDHSTVLHSLRKHGIKTVQTLPLTDKAEEIHALWRQGLTQQAIAARVGYTQSSVCRYMRRQPWWPKPKRKRHVRDVGDRVAEMIAQGATLKAISDDIGFRTDTIAMYARSVGLLPPPSIRHIEDSADVIKKMFLKGSSYDQIGLVTGFHPSALGKFVRKQGWRR